MMGVNRLPAMKGIGYYSETFINGRQPPLSAATNYYVAQKKFTHVRMGIIWELIQPTLNGALDSSVVSMLDTVLSDVTSAGGTMILDLHNYGRRELTVGSGTTYIIGETANITSAHFSDLWGRIATQWNTSPNIQFNIMNEPHDQDTDILVSVTNAAIAAIRATGARQRIYVCANQWNSTGWVDDTYGNKTKMLGILDTANNLMFDVHHYFDAFSAGQSDAMVSEATWKAGLDGFTTWARANGKRAICGEFGAPPTTSGHAALQSFLTYLNVNSDVWKGWIWLAGGGWWQQGYSYLLDPYASAFDGSNPDRWVGGGGTGKALLWDAPRIDKPQMVMLQPYLSPAAVAFNGADV